MKQNRTQPAVPSNTYSKTKYVGETLRVYQTQTFAQCLTPRNMDKNLSYLVSTCKHARRKGFVAGGNFQNKEVRKFGFMDFPYGWCMVWK